MGVIFGQDESQYACDCKSVKDHLHKNSCKLYKFRAWSELLCEWDGANKKFRWDIAALDAYGKAAEKHQENARVGPPQCRCNPERSWRCVECGVERENVADFWEWIDFADISNENFWEFVENNYGNGIGVKGDKPVNQPANDSLPPASVATANTTASQPGQKVDGQKKFGFAANTGGVSYGGGSGYGSVGATNYTPKCRHMEKPVKFPDKTVVYASSSASSEKPTGIPDFTLYAASSWQPRGIATYIPWRDYGLPEVPWYFAAGAIKEAFENAKQGFSVEIGCIGGHGRTGTILACMAVLAGIRPRRAVKWVRKHYCNHAVESDKQEWFVLWFAAWAHGEESPSPPWPVDTPGSLVEPCDAPRKSSYSSSTYSKPATTTGGTAASASSSSKGTSPSKSGEVFAGMFGF